MIGSGGDFGQLIDDRPKGGRRDRLALGVCCLKPRRFSLQHFSQRLLRSNAESGAAGKIGDVGNVSAVFIAVENVDVVVSHSSPPKNRLYRSTRASNCFT